MDLRKAANRFEGTAFDTYTESTSLWTTEAFYGKIMPVDRFLSNFHRPTHRRMLGLDPSITLPSDNTVRVPSTGDVYILGQVRGDDNAGTHYDRLVIAHLSELGLATVSRKSPAGPANDPGHLVSADTGTHYADVELRSVSEQEESIDAYDGNYFATLPPHADVQEWDFITLASTSYRVKEAYVDSGFKYCRVVKMADPRVDFTYHYRGVSGYYDPGLGEVTDGFTDYNVTGFQRDEKSSENQQSSKSHIVVAVFQDHIGVTPSVNDEITWEGKKYKVSRVYTDYQNNQFHLYCDY